MGLLPVLLGLPAAVASPTDDVPVVRLDGRGHGHGVGLSQWGARAMAAGGADAATILGHYYPGTSIGTGTGEVVVAVADGDRALISLPGGGELRSARDGPQAAGFPIPLDPGEVVAVHHDGTGYRVERGGVRALADGSPQTFEADGDCVLLCTPPGRPEPDPAPGDDGTLDPEADPGADPDQAPDGGPTPEDGPAPGGTPDDCSTCSPGTAPTEERAPDRHTPEPPVAEPAGGAPWSPTPVWAVPAGGTVRSVDRGRTYRGLLEVTGGPGRVRVRNHVDVEDYLRGMAEVPGSWPAAAVQAQAVAARTYALRAMADGGEICDSESCQVYAGVARENPGQDAAVAATRGWVVTHGGRLAATFYSASAGGHSATVQEGFGSALDVPYLQARPEPAGDVRPWQLDLALADVGSRLGYPGRVTGVRIDASGPSGRPLAMTVEGDAGDRPVDPQTFRRRLGLRSTFFTVQSSTAEEAPPPPPAPVAHDQLPVEPAGGPPDLAAGGHVVVSPRSLPPAGPLDAARAGRATVAAVAVALLAVVIRTRTRALVRPAWGRRLTVPAVRWPATRRVGGLAATMSPWKKHRAR